MARIAACESGNEPFLVTLAANYEKTPRSAQHACRKRNEFADAHACRIKELDQRVHAQIRHRIALAGFRLRFRLADQPGDVFDAQRLGECAGFLRRVEDARRVVRAQPSA